jgi:threonine/homoserine/homoserine lactone efflux protein
MLMMTQQSLLFTLMIIAMVATMGALMFGLVVMARGGQVNKLWSNRLMRWRIGVQGLALALFALFLILSKGGN